MQNLRTARDERGPILSEFVHNSRDLPVRKNGNILYHEILSFKDEDRGKLTKAILEDLTRRYLEARAPLCLAYAKAHLDAKHPHVHLMISANPLGSRKRHYVSKTWFNTIKLRLEQYQSKHYPFLDASIAMKEERQKRGLAVAEKEKVRQGWKEKAREFRLARTGESIPSRKEEIQSIVLKQMTLAASEEAFLLRLNFFDLAPYVRGNGEEVTGIKDGQTGRKFRLRTIGVSERYQMSHRQWASIPGRLQAGERVELEKARRLWQEMGFKEDIRTILSFREDDQRFSEEHRQKLSEIRRVLFTKREHERKEFLLELDQSL